MPAAKEKVLHILTGPTAVGKTDLALQWAETGGAEIISCDSLLFYRGMDIGTAKPTRQELLRVPHHLVDVADVRERMDVARYVVLARAAADDIHARGRDILVVGGSGFYLRSFFSAVTDDVEVPEQLRAEIAARLESHGLAALVAELEQLDPSGARTIDLSNPRRVIRALERCRATGKTLRELADDFSRTPGPFRDWKIRMVRLERPAEELGARARMRVDAMLRGGLVEEVKGLLDAGLLENPSASKAIGYRETIDYLGGALPLNQLADEITKNTRGLLKKQRTWFRTQLPPHLALHPVAWTERALREAEVILPK